MVTIEFCRRRGCCPTIQIVDGEYIIGEGDNKVILTESQYKDLKSYFRWEPFIRFYRWVCSF